ncbi:hypothetical protein EW146_g2359 [Bondarzewia mesenterica]|uniref:DUF6533 domain-containing protein n=1 Tax=Bondarzewia mesenterica TaxID=1095465 RepID=A0A4S4M0Y9_9AGAM|nr:hypothetical protein EW146_g2359 [Bondarzewia mesenterica]
MGWLKSNKDRRYALLAILPLASIGFLGAIRTQDHRSSIRDGPATPAQSIWRTNIVSVCMVSPAYFHVCAATILLYDYALTFEQEVKYVWNSPFGAAKIMFFITRYSVVIDLTVILYYQFMKDASSYECSLIFNITGWLIVWGLALSQLLIILRTWALWTCDKRIGVGLAILLAAIQAVDCFTFAKFLSSLTFVPMSSIFPHLKRGCVVSGGSEILIVDCVLLAFFDTVIVILTLINGLRHQHVPRSNSKLIDTLYRDGEYFANVVSITLTNVIIIFTAPSEYTNMLASIQRVMYSILPSRILLSIRQAAQPRDGPYPYWTHTLGGQMAFYSHDSDLCIEVGRQHGDEGRTAQPFFSGQDTEELQNPGYEEGREEM